MPDSLRALRRAACALALPIVCACAAEPASNALPAAAPPPPLTGTSVAERLREYAENALALDDPAPAAVRAAHGAADSTAARPTPNRHLPGQTDSIVTLHYPGLTLEAYRTADGRELVQRVDVLANRWLRRGPGIGAGREDVREALGVPTEQSDSSLAYLCTECGPVEEPITFFFSDGRVRCVRFAFYVD